MMFWGAWGMQDALNMTLEQIIYFHDYLMIVMLVIMMVVGYFIGFSIVMKGYSSTIVTNHLVESVWTVLPIVVLVFLVYPSIYLLYLIDENSTNFLCSLKVVGHQWYWAYEFDGLKVIELDSYIDNDSIIRLLDVDNHVLVPVQEFIRALISSNDVLHSWALPSLGVKMDAIPGRLNQFVFMVMINSVVHGQCSEICGVNHSFMPIVMEALDMNCFLS